MYQAGSDVVLRESIMCVVTNLGATLDTKRLFRIADRIWEVNLSTGLVDE